jgi:uncharacterized repeat protein (TIGR03803 family)
MLCAAMFCIAFGGGSVVWADPTLTTLVTFDNTNGSAPYGGLVTDAAGNLYGATAFGGSTGSGGLTGSGTLFELTVGTHAFSTLISFDGQNQGPSNLVADAAGNLYGTTYEGGAKGRGTVFKLAAGTDEITDLFSFDFYTNGGYPMAGLVADADGNLYGTTSAGGAYNDGTVFELSDTGFVVPEPTAASPQGCVGVALLARRRRRLRSGTPG